MHMQKYEGAREGTREAAVSRGVRANLACLCCWLRCFVRGGHRQRWPSRVAVSLNSQRAAVSLVRATASALVQRGRVRVGRARPVELPCVPAPLPVSEAHVSGARRGLPWACAMTGHRCGRRHGGGRERTVARPATRTRTRLRADGRAWLDRQ